MNQRDPSREVSANDFIGKQTEAIKKEFGCSLPRPRNRVMGFRGTDKPKRWIDPKTTSGGV
jgi:hypothetical protein